jgi:hypothetical protein
MHSPQQRKVPTNAPAGLHVFEGERMVHALAQPQCGTMACSHHLARVGMVQPKSM